MRLTVAKLFCCAVSAMLFCAGGASSAAEKVTLSATPAAGDIRVVSVTLKVGGDLLLPENKATKKLKMSVEAHHQYDERLIELEGAQRHALRHYQQATAKLKIDNGQIEPTLNDAHRLIAVETTQDSSTLFSPRTPLSRDELDLLEVPGNSVLVDLLLPTEAVEVGETWKPEMQLWGPLLGLEKISASDVECRLAKVTAEQATVEGSGHIDGAVDGVASEIEVKLRILVDRAKHSITDFTMAVQEKRSIGHVAAGLDVVAQLTMKIRPLSASTALNDEVAAEPWSEDPSARHLVYDSELGRYRLLHDRRWHILDEEGQLLVLRLVDKGELVAQCNVSALPATSQGKEITAEDFQADVQKVLGDSFEQFVHAEQWNNDRQVRFVHIIAAGKVDKLPIQWHYYLATNPAGRHLSFAFTVEADLAERFTGEDRTLVESLVFAEPVAQTTRSRTTNLKR